MSGKRAVVLLSGGLDSTTVLAIAKDEGFAPYALSFRYGQRHVAELGGRASGSPRRPASRAHVVADIDLRMFGGSALTDDIDVPKAALATPRWPTGIPVTYVPARNTIFLSFALAWAEALGASDIFIGVNALDYSGYPDCRPEYIEAFERMANLATKAGVEGTQRLKIHTPLIAPDQGGDHPARARARRRLRPHASVATTPTQQGRACGTCDSCLLRLQGLRGGGHRRIPPRYQQDAAVAMTLHGQGDLLHAAGRGRQRRAARRCSAASPAATSGRAARRTAPRAICTVLRHRLRRHRRRRRRQVPHRRGARRRRRGAVAGANGRGAAASWSAPAASRSCSSTRPLIDASTTRGFEVAVETNGTLEPPDGIDWICVSPKAGAETGAAARQRAQARLPAAGRRRRALRRRSTSSTSSCSRWTAPTSTRNTATRASSTASSHPQWQLSLQTHKYLGIP